jgi:hypothetical protein
MNSFLFAQMPPRRRMIYWQVSGHVGQPFSFLVGGLASRPAKRPAGHVERSSLEQHRAEDGIGVSTSSDLKCNNEQIFLSRNQMYSTFCINCQVKQTLVSVQ